jgi:hypothetical protein
VAKELSHQEYLITTVLSSLVLSSLISVHVFSTTTSHVTTSPEFAHDKTIHVSTELSIIHVFITSFSSTNTVHVLSDTLQVLVSVFHQFIFHNKLNIFTIDRIHAIIKQNMNNIDNLLLNIFEPNILHNNIYTKNDHATHINNFK